MLEGFKKLLADLTEGGKHESRFAEDDYRLAAAALLVHTATIDGAMGPAERARLHTIVKQRFALDDEAADALVAEATEAEEQAIDFYQFTSRLIRSLDDKDRARVVEMMWQVVFADGEVNEFEDNLIWRAADLLHVPSEERIALRERVSGVKATENS